MITVIPPSQPNFLVISIELEKFYQWRVCTVHTVHTIVKLRVVMINYDRVTTYSQSFA